MYEPEKTKITKKSQDRFKRALKKSPFFRAKTKNAYSL